MELNHLIKAWPDMSAEEQDVWVKRLTPEDLAMLMARVKYAPARNAEHMLDKMRGELLQKLLKR